jgi:ATP-binding cassette subfamily B protein
MPDHHEEDALGKAYDARLARRLLKYLRPYRGRVVLAVLLSILTALAATVIPYFTKLVVDVYLLPGVHGTLPADAAFRGVQWIALAFCVALLLGFALTVAQVLVMQMVGQRTMFDLRVEIFDHLQRLPMSFFDRNPVGRLVTRVTSDVDVLYELFASGVVAMLSDVFKMLFFIAAMIWLDWRLTVVTLGMLPFLLLITVLFRRSFRDANRRIRAAVAKINSFLQEYISGMTVVQLFNRERRALQQFSQVNRDHMLAFKDAILAHALFYPAIEFLGVAAVAALLWFGGTRVLADLGLVSQGALRAENAFQLGTVVSFMQYAQGMFRPIQDLGEKFTILQSAMASSERIFKLLDEPLHESTGTARIAQPRGEIEFRNVWFAYPPPPASQQASATAAAPVASAPADENWVLRDVSFRAAPGETIALVGHTGAGKTTIISLLLRFYEIQRGQILLDGRDIRDLDIHELRRRFGIVLQDPFLFTGTLESNIRLGTEGVTREAVRSALEEVRLGQMLAALPDGLESPVTERGATYSVGQRQLISFARALAHDPRFLILDEATSSVDTQTESMIRAALDRLLEGRTAVVIAHRLSTIQRAHRILVLHKGKLREQGTHQQLLAQRGIYFRLYQLQYKDQERLSPGLLASAPSGASLPADD